ncbi:polysaccharide biosynthesis protein [Streptomyces roseirectus]|uniref:Polysaccharide biosynthesis protein n=1 Tax=Streptomyces roseirectus TaxID=2768066 RepID=A0A7H0I5S1_9ACTN|nr:Wzz/FepE/Etk N-terminal domain-containing protein [Streptomyces roseirectus]QNP68137.1 polysaccharide biosynthesis protein [Streptomyces roseirectus]
MSDDTIRLVTIGRLIRRRRRLLMLLTVLGALVGYGVSVLFPPRYTASAQVLLPGVWQERELLTQTQLATSSVVTDRVAAALHWPGVSGADLEDRVSATAAEGNIVKVSGTAETPRRAQQLADQTARQFVSFAGRIAGDGGDPGAAAGPEELRQLVIQTGRRINELADAAGSGRSVESVQTRTELAKLRTTLQEAVTKLNEADPAAGKASMVVMGPAPRPAGEAPPTRVQLAGGGALLFFVGSVVGHLTAARLSRRPRSEPEIAAALGSVLLGGVDVPGDGRGPRAAAGDRRERLRRLVGADVRWDLPAPRAAGDEESLLIRYRRVCARLREHRQVLLVVPGGDSIARRAADTLAAEAGTRPVLRVVEAEVDHPLVPDRAEESGAVVLLSAGRWSAGELTGLAEACADAGHEIVGVVLAGPVRTRAGRRAERVPEAAVPVAGGAR